MIKISFLPYDVIRSLVKTFPISDNFAHRFVTREREHRVDVIRHHQKERDMPSQFRFIESCRIQNPLSKRGLNQRPLLFLTIESDADVKLRARLYPVRHPMMQALREAAINLQRLSRYAATPQMCQEILAPVGE